MGTLDVGIPECELSDLAGGDAKLNAQILTDALGGEKGPVADCLMLNAGVAMAAAAQAESVEEGIAMCKVRDRVLGRRPKKNCLHKTVFTKPSLLSLSPSFPSLPSLLENCL